jgi:hypothetical protein
LTEDHLSETQFGELLAEPAATSSSSASQAHLLTCAQCAAEFASLRDALSLFRQAGTAYADNQLRRMPQISVPVRPMLPVALEPAYFVAAAAILLAALLPMQNWHRYLVSQQSSAAAAAQDQPPQPAESDEALLDDVNRDLSASVPAPMQALADPTGGTNVENSIQNSDQRKD